MTLQETLYEIMAQYDNNEITNHECITRMHQVMFPPKVLKWQFATTHEPEIWVDATNEAYEKGKDLIRFTWRQVEK